ncbi:hypothetical protein Csac_2626 [Caldicellulosiruptor saccharolyticus DSM 8903]|uniref:Uncharacterized protein n=2 Tax=Caldicellulosiruptor saccharolyticus TaxID=44001 RepID=A4XMR2_CALS8|nr:hypothetical protein Csac_2626 [Caldicellulosiruptor saccharolyticus DSM 8903]
MPSLLACAYTTNSIVSAMNKYLEKTLDPAAMPDVNLVPDPTGLSTCSLWKLSIDGTNGVDLGSQISGGVAKIYYQQLKNTTYVAIRFVFSPSATNYAYTVDKNKAYIVSFSAKRVQATSEPLSLYAKGPAINGGTYNEKKVGTLNDNSVSVSSNVKLVDFTTDGEYQTCTFKIMPNFWDGTGNTITFFVTPESQVVQTYEFYIKNPYFAQD